MQNLANFNPNGKLGKMFAQAKTYNQINKELKKQLPLELNGLELCFIDKDQATLITNNQALAFRANKQTKLLIKILRQIKSLKDISKVKIRVEI